MPAYTLTLGDARNSAALKKVAGVCTTGDDFRDYVNEATERLLKRGAWFGTEVVSRFCFQGCDVVFPRWVGTVEGVRICGAQVQMNNSWWSIVSPTCSYPGLSGYAGIGYGGYSNSGIAPGWLGVRDNGTAPCYSEISGTTGKQIAYSITRPEDVGKTCIIFGTQYGGQPLAEFRDGVWSQGITIAAKSAGGSVLPAMTSALVTKITSVVRESTVGVCRLWEYGSDGAGVVGLRDIAQYQPTETNPSYRRMRVDGMNALGCKDSNGICNRSLEAICKLEFIPVISDYDFLLISDFQALKLAIQALRLEDAEDTQAAELKWQSSIRELNYLDRSKSPSNQISVAVNVSGCGYTLVNPI